MKIAHAKDVPWVVSGSRHREITDEIKYMLQGPRGHKQNYQLMLTRNTERTTSPPHKHNFEQVRYCFAGVFGNGKEHRLRAGEVGYYPEGVPYAIDCDFSEVMLIQFAGPTGEGYTNHEDLAAVFPEVEKLGKFVGGIFHRNPDADLPAGTKLRQDGFEAMWEHVNKRALVYPRGRYKAPVAIRPSAMAWVPIEGQQNVERKLLGVFSERAIEICQYRVQPAARLALERVDAPRILLVIEGSGQIETADIAPQTTVHLDAGEAVVIVAREELLLLSITLPWFSDVELGAA